MDNRALLTFLGVILLIFCPSLNGEQPKLENPRNLTKIYPLWKEEENVRDYAARTGVSAEFDLELPDGKKIEMVLIPAGRFIMGIPKPVSPPISLSYGLIVSAIGLAVIIAVLGRIMWMAIARKTRPQFSLRLFILIIFALSGLTGGIVQDYLLRKLIARFEAEEIRYDNSLEEERVAHAVTISTSFYLSRYEITEEQFLLDPSEFKRSHLPVTKISWHEAVAFCERLKGLVKLDVRLPTEAEWEFACRAGTTTEYHCGDQSTALNLCGWYGKNSSDKVQLVGKKEMNRFGLYDMHGNVSEWCADWYIEYGSDSVVDPTGPKTGSEKIIRGGSVIAPSVGCKSYSRSTGDPTVFSDFLGFRIAVSVPATR